MEIGDFLVGVVDAVDAVDAGFFVRLSLARLKLLFSANFSPLFSFSPNGSVSNGELSLEGTKLAFVGCTFNVLKMS